MTEMRDGEKQQIVDETDCGGRVSVWWRTERVVRREIKMLECEL